MQMRIGKLIDRCNRVDGYESHYWVQIDEYKKHKRLVSYARGTAGDGPIDSNYQWLNESDAPVFSGI